MSAVGGYRGDALKSKAIGTLSADAVNAHGDANLIRRIFRARPSSHSDAMLSHPRRDADMVQTMVETGLQ